MNQLENEVATKMKMLQQNRAIKTTDTNEVVKMKNYADTKIKIIQNVVIVVK